MAPSASCQGVSGLKLHEALGQYLASSKIRPASSTGTNVKSDLRTAKTSSGVGVCSMVEECSMAEEDDPISTSMKVGRLVI